VYSPAITDFVFMVKNSSYMFVTGPDVIKAVTHEEVSFEELGGASTHGATSGVAHFAAENEEECLALIRELLTFLPQNNAEDPPIRPSLDPLDRVDEELQTVVPDQPNRPYDIKDIVRPVLDDRYFFEVHADYAPNLVIGFGRLGGRPVGIVANQPAHLAGCLDINASLKGARFVRFCDCFNIPIVTFEDVPGFLPGTAQEFGGIIKHGAKLLFAFCEATVPKLTVITRKAYGGAYCVMSSKHIRGDANFAFPTAEIAVMGPDGAVNILYRREVDGATDPAALKDEKVREYREKFANPYAAAERGYIDEVIEPRDTRRRLIQALEVLHTKRDVNPPKKHGNIPL
jgi:propionyl-CoA carboxylase beta chain